MNATDTECFSNGFPLFVFLVMIIYAAKDIQLVLRPHQVIIKGECSNPPAAGKKKE